MKPFDLAKALLGDPVITRRGDKIREVYRFNGIENEQKIFAHAEGEEELTRYDDEGRLYYSKCESDHDLFMAPKVKKYYLNIYKMQISEGFTQGQVLSDLKASEQERRNMQLDFFKTLEFEVEE